MEDICTSIYASLEGTKNWTARGYQNKAEREAYIHAFCQCQGIVINYHLNPEGMLLALDQYHDEILAQKKSNPFKNWPYNTIEAKEQAVRVVFDAVNSLIKRFLWIYST